jgi:2-oxoglutarate ferredoxin oxidoreductase subunit beta
MKKRDLVKLIENKDIYESYTTRDETVNWWCGGCGNYPIQQALKQTLALEGLRQRDVLFCYDVGCSGNGSDKIEGYTIHGLHGRVLPLAAGAKIANPNLHVIAEAGDGATFSEGVGHLVHAVRNDYPVLFILHDNQNYALTTGQPSALTPKGCKMNAAPEGSPVDAFNPLEVVLGLKPSFVAQTCSANVDHMVETFRMGMKHKGFAFINVLQACPTYNKFITHEWYLEHIRPITQDFPDYDPTDIWAARKVAESQDPFYLGLMYHNPEKENFLDAINGARKATTAPVDEVKNYDVSSILNGL